LCLAGCYHGPGGHRDQQYADHGHKKPEVHFPGHRRLPPPESLLRNISASLVATIMPERSRSFSHWRVESESIVGAFAQRQVKKSLVLRVTEML
jgi:hypothetical protein